MTTPLVLLLVAGAVIAQTQPAQLRVSMIAVGVTDMARSLQFYTETLQLPLVGKPGEVTLVKAGDVTIVLNHPLARASGNAIVGAIEIIFPVDSVAASFKNLSDRGCKFIHDPHEVTTGLWAATFTDPDGHRLTILGSR